VISLTLTFDVKILHLGLDITNKDEEKMRNYLLLCIQELNKIYKYLDLETIEIY
jgi:hypothetical protein